MKVGIFGGTFDPIHFGHLFLAQVAMEEAGLDKVLFMPSPDPYYRTDKTVSPFKDRAEMVKLAIDGNPDFEFSDFEARREGPTYTADTLKAFTSMHKDYDIYFILGGDSLFSIENWKEPETIFSLCTILSSKRDRQSQGASGNLGPTVQGTESVASKTADDPLEDEFNRQCQYLKDKFNARIINVNLPCIDISSSDIIRRVRSGKNTRYFMPDAVRDYIAEKRMYQ